MKGDLIQSIDGVQPAKISLVSLIALPNRLPKSVLLKATASAVP